MTRPMGEPTPNRRIAAAQSAVRQLQRRPSPFTGATIPLVGALVTRSLSDPVSIVSGTTPTVLSWTVEEFDTGNIFTGGSRLTVQEPGVYCIAGTGSFVFNATGDRHTSIIRNGGGTTSVSAGPAGSLFFWAGSVLLVDQFSAGEYCELRVAQSSGGNLNTGDMYFSLFAIGSL